MLNIQGGNEGRNIIITDKKMKQHFGKNTDTFLHIHTYLHRDQTIRRELQVQVVSRKNLLQNELFKNKYISKPLRQLQRGS